VTLLVISPDYASHALPLLALARAWQDAGERVVVATGPAIAPRVIAAGMEFAQLSLGRGSNDGIARPGHQPPGEREALRGFFEATRRGMIETVRYQARARSNDLLWRPVAAARRTLEIVERVQPEAILVDHLAFGATIGLRAAGIPYADVVLGHPRQLPVGGEVYGVPGAWPRAFAVDAIEMDRARQEARAVANAFTAAYNDALREIVPRAAEVADAFAAHGDLVLFNYPAALHNPARTALLPANHAFLGATIRADEPEPEVLRWLEGRAALPLVLVSLGTFLSARDDVLATVVRGLSGLDVRVAMATGSADPARLGPIPGHWLVRPYLPQVTILERAQALVTHAGNNSVTEALAHAVPMLALPFSTDQFDGAAAVEEAGVAIARDPNRLTSREVASAISRLLDGQHPALAGIAAGIRRVSAPGAAMSIVTRTKVPAALPIRERVSRAGLLSKRSAGPLSARGRWC
jgi:zeaxanthin glucosyltransferase